MNIYLDFEATQFKGNIIAIGAYCDRGQFDCLVKPPKGDKVTKFITRLTGITPEMAKNALSIEEAFFDLYEWIFSITQDNIGGPTFFHVFGDMDKVFLRNAARHCSVAGIKKFIKKLADSLIDDSKEVCEYFHTKAVGVYKGLKFFEPDIQDQDHDPLNDAIALQKLMFHINFSTPLKECPFKDKVVNDTTQSKYIITAVKNKNHKIKIQTFLKPEEAYHWAYQEVIKTNPWALKKNVSHNVRKAFLNNGKYLGWTWEKKKV